MESGNYITYVAPLRWYWGKEMGNKTVNIYAPISHNTKTTHSLNEHRLSCLGAILCREILHPGIICSHGLAYQARLSLKEPITKFD